jgi:hypothetical protein
MQTLASLKEGDWSIGFLMLTYLYKIVITVGKQYGGIE